MAFSKKTCRLAIFVVFLLLLFFISARIAQSFPTENEGVETTMNCEYECKRRCSKAKRIGFCQRACGTCCERCHCVPPGTHGNTETCPCYAQMKTHDGRLKCP
ncbi:putative Gibberellin-regulated protein 2 [Zostera marina]|uniref:Putative Gibberellin-regulated protein 2 n=1 Tax=Zostera marina TaxID=29655 RepID=A0A0K9NT26_ZOSMR|nr:putative Gibberellin-regulated protein 2 [Zostera marina]